MRKKSYKTRKAERELKVQAALGTKKVARLLFTTSCDGEEFSEMEKYIGWLGEVNRRNLGIVEIAFTDGAKFVVAGYHLEFL